MIYGLDVSSYQPVDFRLTMPGTGDPVDFVIIKVTQGTDYVNPKWMAQLDWARQNGLAVGFYHFGKVGGVRDQVAFFLRTLGTRSQPGDSFWYDWEASDGWAPTSSEKDDFIRTLKDSRPGYRVGLYCNVDYWKNRDTTSYCGDALWIAHWRDTDPPIEHPWTIHQFSSQGIDQNRAQFVDRAAMIAWAGGSSGQLDSVTIMEAVMQLDSKLDEILRRLA